MHAEVLENAVEFTIDGPEAILHSSVLLVSQVGQYSGYSAVLVVVGR